MLKINDTYSVIKGSDNPLSSDVCIIKGKKYNYIFDVGNNSEVLDELNNIDNKIIIISHFHIDHIGNLRKLQYEKLYVGNNTRKYTNDGDTVGSIEIDDGIKIKLFEIECSHVKGAIGMMVCEYAFIGDALAPQIKNNEYVYNVQKLKEEIDVLSSLNVKYLVDSHHMDKPMPKQEVIDKLTYIYNKKQKNNPFLVL